MKTRFEQFNLAITYFLNENDLFGSIKPINDNNSRSSTQRYVLDIPSEHTFAERFIDDYVVDNYKPTTITQQLPEIDIFVEKFTNYFDEFKKVEYDNKEQIRTVKSFVSISDTIYYTTTSSKSGVKAKILVQYHNSWLPYPQIEYNELLHKTNKKHNENTLLKERIMKTRRMLHHNNNVYKRRDKLNSKKFETITNIIREYYKNSNEKKDCPVCYEIIKPENLYVSGCKHYICESCALKCENCPLCRENYLYKKT
jgi:hypothetical protein